MCRHPLSIVSLISLLSRKENWLLLLITILDNRCQTTIRNYFLKYPLKVRQQVQFITMDMSGVYIPLARKLFPNAKIVLDRFHIIQHLGRAFLKTRIAIMNQFDKKYLPYQAIEKSLATLSKRQP